MKPKDLMIGDWVQVLCLIDNVEHYDAWCKVKQLRDCDLDVIGFKELKYNEIMPISLTAEILEKNGYTRNTFEYNTTKIEEWVSEDGRITMRDGAVIANSNNEWSVHIDNEDMQTIGYFELTYVHEFQHALRFCGIEKEIKL